eukprot:gene14267-21881_t
MPRSPPRAVARRAFGSSDVPRAVGAVDGGGGGGSGDELAAARRRITDLEDTLQRERLTAALSKEKCTVFHRARAETATGYASVCTAEAAARLAVHNNETDARITFWSKLPRPAVPAAHAGLHSPGRRSFSSLPPVPRTPDEGQRARSPRVPRGQTEPSALALAKLLALTEAEARTGLESEAFGKVSEYWCLAVTKGSERARAEKDRTIAALRRQAARAGEERSVLQSSVNTLAQEVATLRTRLSAAATAFPQAPVTVVDRPPTSGTPPAPQGPRAPSDGEADELVADGLDVDEEGQVKDEGEMACETLRRKAAGLREALEAKDRVIDEMHRRRAEYLCKACGVRAFKVNSSTQTPDGYDPVDEELARAEQERDYLKSRHGQNTALITEQESRISELEHGCILLHQNLDASESAFNLLTLTSEEAASRSDICHVYIQHWASLIADRETYYLHHRSLDAVPDAPPSKEEAALEAETAGDLEATGLPPEAAAGGPKTDPPPEAGAGSVPPASPQARRDAEKAEFYRQNLAARSNEYVILRGRQLLEERERELSGAPATPGGQRGALFRGDARAQGFDARGVSSSSPRTLSSGARDPWQMAGPSPRTESESGQGAPPPSIESLGGAFLCTPVVSAPSSRTLSATNNREPREGTLPPSGASPLCFSAEATAAAEGTQQRPRTLSPGGKRGAASATGAAARKASPAPDEKTAPCRAPPACNPTPKAAAAASAAGRGLAATSRSDSVGCTDISARRATQRTSPSLAGPTQGPSQMDLPADKGQQPKRPVAGSAVDPSSSASGTGSRQPRDARDTLSSSVACVAQGPSQMDLPVDKGQHPTRLVVGSAVDPSSSASGAGSWHDAHSSSAACAADGCEPAAFRSAASSHTPMATPAPPATPSSVPSTRQQPFSLSVSQSPVTPNTPPFAEPRPAAGGSVPFPAESLAGKQPKAECTTSRRPSQNSGETGPSRPSRMLEPASVQSQPPLTDAHRQLDPEPLNPAHSYPTAGPAHAQPHRQPATPAIHRLDAPSAGGSPAPCGGSNVRPALAQPQPLGTLAAHHEKAPQPLRDTPTAGSPAPGGGCSVRPDAGRRPGAKPAATRFPNTERELEVQRVESALHLNAGAAAAFSRQGLAGDRDSTVAADPFFATREHPQSRRTTSPSTRQGSALVTPASGRLPAGQTDTRGVPAMQALSHRKGILSNAASDASSRQGVARGGGSRVVTPRTSETSQPECSAAGAPRRSLGIATPRSDSPFQSDRPDAVIPCTSLPSAAGRRPGEQSQYPRYNASAGRGLPAPSADPAVAAGGESRLPRGRVSSPADGMSAIVPGQLLSRHVSDPMHASGSLAGKGAVPPNSHSSSCSNSVGYSSLATPPSLHLCQSSSQGHLRSISDPRRPYGCAVTAGSSPGASLSIGGGRVLCRSFKEFSTAALDLQQQLSIPPELVLNVACHSSRIADAPAIELSFEQANNPQGVGLYHLLFASTLDVKAAD